MEWPSEGVPADMMGDVTPITAEEYQQQLDRFVLVEDLGNWLDEEWYETSWAWLSFWNAIYHGAAEISRILSHS